MAIGDIIVGIDIGTSKVCTVVGEVNNFGQIEIICNTSYKCSGLKKGKIINEEEISLSIAKTIKDAEDETNLKINSAYVTIQGKYVTIVQNSITKEVKDKYSGISVRDVQVHRGCFCIDQPSRGIALSQLNRGLFPNSNF